MQMSTSMPGVLWRGGTEDPRKEGLILVDIHVYNVL